MKERLTGAIILVVLIVLLVPELLSGPKGSSVPTPGASASSSEEPPLKSYTINLGDESRTRAAANGGNGPAMPQLNGPEQPSTQSGAVPGQAEQGASQSAVTAESGQASGPTAQVSGGSTTTSAPGTNPQPSRPAANSEASPSATNGTPSRSASSSTQTTPQSGSRQAGKPQAGAPPQSAARTNAPQSGAASTRSAQSASSKPSQSDSRSANASASKSTNSAAPKSASTAAATSAPKSESGWAVQLGVFHSRENAERMALEARVKGFKASVSSSVSHNQKLYRVRVGPVADRAAAQELQSRLKASGRPAGAVVPIS